MFVKDSKKNSFSNSWTFFWQSMENDYATSFIKSIQIIKKNFTYNLPVVYLYDWKATEEFYFGKKVLHISCYMIVEYFCLSCRNNVLALTRSFGSYLLISWLLYIEAISCFKLQFANVGAKLCKICLLLINF